MEIIRRAYRMDEERGGNEFQIQAWIHDDAADRTGDRTMRGSHGARRRKRNLSLLRCFRQADLLRPPHQQGIAIIRHVRRPSAMAAGWNGASVAAATYRPA